MNVTKYTVNLNDCMEVEVDVGYISYPGCPASDAGPAEPGHIEIGSVSFEHDGHEYDLPVEVLSDDDIVNIEDNLSELAKEKEAEEAAYYVQRMRDEGF